MITTIKRNNITEYRDDQSRFASVAKIDGKYIITFSGTKKIGRYNTIEEAQECLRKHFNAIPMRDFLSKYKGIINQSGLAEIAGRSVNYMSHVVTGRRPTNDKLNEAVEKALRDLAKELVDINII